MKRRSWLVPATLLACLVEIGIALAFMVGRQALPSDPVRFDTWGWSSRWMTQAVGVVPVPGAMPVRNQGTGYFAFRDPTRGSVRWLNSVGGHTLEEWADSWLGTGPRLSQARIGGPISYLAWCNCVMDADPNSWENRLRTDTVASYLPVTDALAPAGAWLSVTVAATAIALVAWLLRPHEAWRCGWLVGMTAITSCSFVWELGLRPTDLLRSEPMLPLFVLTGPMALVFWSSVVQVLANLPARSDPVLRGRRLIVPVYLAPQVALAAGVLLTRWQTASTLDWIGSWARVLGVVVAGLGVVAAVAAWRLHDRTTSRPRWAPVALALPVVLCAFLWPGLGVRPGIAACLLVAALVLVAPAGRPTRRQALALSGAVVCAVLVLVAPASLGVERVLPRGLAVDGTFPRLPDPPESLPWALLLLGIGVLRYKVYDLDVYHDARRRAIVGREEERRRLRREIHDGLGPTLAAMSLALDVARDRVRTDPEAAEAAIDRVRDDARTAIVEVRRLVRDLRPSALDDLGLVDALRLRIEELGRTTQATGSGPGIELAAATLPPLDAATEMAAYRIVLEAVHNVLRHAAARRCVVRISATDTLDIEVADDGVGPAPDASAGVGLVAMRERATELGGSFRFQRSPDGWTRALASLPIG